jgi:hypothetical protein
MLARLVSVFQAFEPPNPANIAKVLEGTIAREPVSRSQSDEIDNTVPMYVHAFSRIVLAHGS